MTKEKILEHDIDIDEFLDKLISNLVIDISERSKFDHEDQSYRKENILNYLLEKESGWETVLVDYLRINNFSDTINEIINTDSGYHGMF